MPDPPAPTPKTAPRSAVALLLAGNAGCVDALAFLALDKAFVAHVSGDSAHAGMTAAHGAFALALQHLAPVPGFAIGVALGRLVADALRRRACKRRMSLVLLLELALLASALALYRSNTLATVLFAAAGMGMQSAALRHVAGHKLRTTFVTGMLVAFADELVESFTHPERRAYVWLHAGVWFAFCVGATCGALAWTGRGLLPALPVAVLLVVTIAWDLIAPFDLNT